MTNEKKKIRVVKESADSQIIPLKINKPPPDDNLLNELSFRFYPSELTVNSTGWHLILQKYIEWLHTSKSKKCTIANYLSPKLNWLMFYI